MVKTIISFDFWNTIAESNPEFKLNQEKYLGVPPGTYLEKTKKIKQGANEAVLQMEEPQLPKLGYFYPVDENIREEFMEESFRLFRQYPPNAKEETLTAIRKLIELRDSNKELGISIGIVSNTLSIPGREIKKYLFEVLNLKLDFFNFSDELDICKPNIKMFDTKNGQVHLHVGDEPPYDNVEGVKFLNVDSINIETVVAIISKEDLTTQQFSEYTYSFKKFKDVESTTFNLLDYSKLKYGSKKVAKSFGSLVASGLIRSKVMKTFLGDSEKDIVIASAPYKFLPVAATSLQKEVHKSLALSGIDREILDFKIYRGHSYNVDYGALSKEERTEVINSDSFHIDSEFIKGKDLILVDDVKITGSHEERMRDLLKRSGFEGKVLFLYFCEYTGEGNPSIENDLNYAYLDLSLEAVDSIIKQEDFILNTRVCKYILDSKVEDFKRFIIKQDVEFQKNLFIGAVTNGYLQLEDFKKNISYLKRLINYRKK